MFVCLLLTLNNSTHVTPLQSCLTKFTYLPKPIWPVITIAGIHGSCLGNTLYKQQYCFDINQLKGHLFSTYAVMGEEGSSKCVRLLFKWRHFYWYFLRKKFFLLPRLLLSKERLQTTSNTLLHASISSHNSLPFLSLVTLQSFTIKRQEVQKWVVQTKVSFLKPRSGVLRRHIQGVVGTNLTRCAQI